MELRDALTQIEVAEVLAERLGRSVRAESIPLDVWERQARTGGLGDHQVETLMKMFRYYERYGFTGNPKVLGWLLGRAPTSFSGFVARVAGSGAR